MTDLPTTAAPLSTSTEGYTYMPSKQSRLGSIECVRFRLNSNGTEWFWANKWHSANHPAIAANLVAAISSVTASYPPSRQFEFENMLLALLIPTPAPLSPPLLILNRDRKVLGATV